MLSEAELIEIEGRAEALADLSGDVLAVLASAFQTGDDYQEGLEAIGRSVAACAVDIATLVEMVRTELKAVA